MYKDINLLVSNVVEQYKLFGFRYCEQPNIMVKNDFILKLPNNLNELEQFIEHCHLCALSNQNKKLSFGIGNPNSDIYIIGTSKYTNKKVFKLFEDMFLSVLGLRQSDYYLLDILKCDSSNYKLSLNEPRKICTEFLKQQLALSNAKLLIIIGDEFEYNKINTIKLFDFEYLYKNPTMEDKMINDMNKIKNYIGVK